MGARIGLMLSMLLALAFVFSGCGDESTNNTPPPDVPTGISATGGKFITVDWDILPDRCYNLYWNTSGFVNTSDNVLQNVPPPTSIKDSCIMAPPITTQ